MSTATPPACLTHTWMPVADRIPNTALRDTWLWRITGAERVMLAAALEAGTAVTAQRREAEGFVLLARCVKEKRA